MKIKIDRIQNLRAFLIYFLFTLFIVADESKSLADVYLLKYAPVTCVVRFILIWQLLTELHIEF